MSRSCPIRTFQLRPSSNPFARIMIFVDHYFLILHSLDQQKIESKIQIKFIVKFGWKCYIPLLLDLLLIHGTCRPDVSAKKAKYKIKKSFSAHGLRVSYLIHRTNPRSKNKTIANHECSHRKKR